MALLILATLSVSSGFCGGGAALGPGGLQSGAGRARAGFLPKAGPVNAKAARGGSTGHEEEEAKKKEKGVGGMLPPQQGGGRRRRLLLLQNAGLEGKVRRIPPQSRNGGHARPTRSSAQPPPPRSHARGPPPSPHPSHRHDSASSSSASSGNVINAMTNATVSHRPSQQGPPGPTALEAVVSKLHNRWSSWEESVKFHAVGDPAPLKINCDKCVAAHHGAHGSSSGSASPLRRRPWSFRPSSIVLGATVPIFLCAAITIIIGITAVSNFVLAGPQRLGFYLALVVLLTVFSCHFSVLQNVTSLRLTDALETIPADRTECRQIIAQQAADHHKSDILWALHAVADLFSAVLAVVGLMGCEDMHDSIDAE